ncbi:MAG: UDP-N-acetylmuramoyl-L-alanine--D-glutamate ligase [Bacteroidales bacterium]|nr:UDP-N-acetylmuramoyl-L-alanine--D-glutamate ligase [Bacteroidales bacterium]
MKTGKIVILGAGESGAGAALLAKKKGFEVFVSDKGIIKEKYKIVLSQADIQFEEGKHSESYILDADEVIKSPGIPDSVPMVRKIKEQGIPVISEIEFAGRYTHAKTICITGSNGKTTTTLLTWHMLNKAGLNVGLAGNVGKSFAWQVAENNFDYYVLEISSFQLDGMFDFKADIAVLLNITPDHLDRYAYDFQKYADSKFRITQNQTPNDAFIYCQDDPVIFKELKTRKDLAAKQYPFSINQQVTQEGAWIKNNNLIVNIKPNLMQMTLEKLALQGKHNLYNSMAAGIAGRILDIRKDIIKESLSDFQNVEHRLEHVARVHGVDFINDSKATNVNATWYALESMPNSVIWVAGGIDKGNDYSLLKKLVKEKVKAIICLGKENSNIINAFKNDVETIIETTDMDDVIKLGIHIGKMDDVVLLSPACASFDLFENFEERGNKFKESVKKL